MAAQDIVVGLWGGPGGNAWDDGSYTGIRGIQLSHGGAIGTFNITYDLNGQPFVGPEHPSPLAFIKATIDLDFPNEYIVSLSGYAGPWSSLATTTPVIRSLTFTTNTRRTFGPYGVEEGIPFNLPIERGLIVGLKGRSGDVLDAIGVHLSL